MAPEASNKPIKAGLSLYANLLDASSTDDTAPGTISRAPIVFKRPPQGDDLQQDEAFASKQQISAGRYQMILLEIDSLYNSDWLTIL